MNEINCKSIDQKTETNADFKISKMFEVQNLKDIFRTAIKVRPNRGRAKIWLLLVSNCILVLSDVRFFSILFPYIEKVIGWDAKQISDVKSGVSVLQFFATALVTGILSKYLKLSDTKLGIIGFVFLYMADVCIGSLLSSIGLYLMYVFASPSVITSVAIRSLLSKIATESESGKVFALLGAVEQIFPSLQVLLYNSLFEFTIDFYPSLCFQIATAFNLFPLFVLIWIDLTHIQLN